jgi:adenosine deaminase
MELHMSVESYLRAMPKVELHIHLEGSIQPETLLELARKNNIKLPASDVDGLRNWYVYRDFDHFIEIFVASCSCLRSPDDFTRITLEYGRRMAAENIRYAEVIWTPGTHVRDDLSFEQVLGGINAGRAQARQMWGVEMRWIPDIVRCLPEIAEQVADWCTSPAALAGGVVALGLGGPEVGWPPELFDSVFATARTRGLHSNPHAGETVGPESVWGALRTLKAERLGHGVRSIEDPALVAYLVEHQIPIEVNPTSNLCLGVYPSYAEHPLRRLLEVGVCATINSDDPALFNTTLVDEYLHAVQDCGLSLKQVEQATLNAVHASYLPAPEKKAMMESFRQEFEQLRLEHGITRTE